MYEPLTPPDKQEALDKIKGEDGMIPFVMTATPVEDGYFLLRFRSGENISVTKTEMNEMINQLSLGLMLGE